MVKVTREPGRKFTGSNDRSKSRTVSKRNLSRKDLKVVKDKKRSEKELKNDKKKEMIRAQRKKEKEERHRRFMPGVLDEKKDKKEKLESEGKIKKY